jgi:hypothetical protein
LITGLGDNAHVYDQFAFQFTDYFTSTGQRSGMLMRAAGYYMVVLLSGTPPRIRNASTSDGSVLRPRSRIRELLHESYLNLSSQSEFRGGVRGAWFNHPSLLPQSQVLPAPG